MSHDEKEKQNRLRLSKEITFGDILLMLVIGVPALIASVQFYDTVKDHEKRITVIENRQSIQDNEIEQNTRDIAVVKATEQLRTK